MSPAGGADADPVEVCRLIVLGQLTRGPRSRAQLAAACHRRGVPDDAVETVLDRFAELGLVDDEAFADAWVASRHSGRGLPRRALRHELQQRGVNAEIVEQALQQVGSDDERVAAERLVQARLPSLARHDRATQARRLQGLLVRRGYAPGLAASVVQAALADAVSLAGADEHP